MMTPEYFRELSQAGYNRIPVSRDVLADPKELAEHLMLIDLGRNDVGRICQTGSVEVTDQMAGYFPRRRHGGAWVRQSVIRQTNYSAVAPPRAACSTSALWRSIAG